MGLPPPAGARVIRLLACLVVWPLLVAPAVAQSTHLLVIVGVGGDEAHRERFHELAATLVDAARDRHGLAADRVVYLGERLEIDPDRIKDRSTWEMVAAEVWALGQRSAPGDTVFLVYIGHGSQQGDDVRLNLPGPDPSAGDVRSAFDVLAGRTVVFVNTASSSGAFLEPLSGERRIIVTATKTGGERDETEFAQYFVEAYGGDDTVVAAADGNKDGRLSVLEAFVYARQRVVEHYEQDGLLLTEHAQLDDDGDGVGSMDFGVESADGRLARAVFLSDAGHGETAAVETDDPELTRLYAERQALETRLEELQRLGAAAGGAAYAAELENVLVDLARTSREIRDREAALAPPPGAEGQP